MKKCDSNIFPNKTGSRLAKGLVTKWHQDPSIGRHQWREHLFHTVREVQLQILTSSHVYIISNGCFFWSLPHPYRMHSFRSKYKNLFSSEPEICLIDSFFYPTTKQNNSLSLEEKDHGITWPWTSHMMTSFKDNFQGWNVRFLKKKSRSLIAKAHYCGRGGELNEDDQD